jgi:single-stranded-DNA-specific exonuclease
MEHSLSRDDIMHALTGAGSNATAIVHRDEEAMTTIRDTGIPTYEFSDFIGMILSMPDASYESISLHLFYDRTIHDESIATLAAILLEAQIVGSEKMRSFIDTAMGLVAIGSIADVVPLEGENRVLVKKGMDGLNAVSHPSISLVLNETPATGRSIGWTVAPLLNTPGRLGKTELAVQFFIERDREAIRRIVSEISRLNDERREFIARYCAVAMDDIQSGRLDCSGGLIDIRADGIPEGYAGLIANRITDATGKPVIVSVLPPRNGLVKGSGRSRGGIPFFSIVQELRERFDRIGGHEHAFGFTVLHEDLDGVIAEISARVGGSSVIDEDRTSADCEISVKDVDVGFIRQLERLEPFGSGNPEPLFRASGVIPSSFAEFSARHGKYQFRGNPALTAIGWGMAEAMRNHYQGAKPLDLLFRLENNTFNGTVRPRMILVDIGSSTG